jgi:hypothetical protein
LDDDGLRRQRLGPPLWKGDIGDGRADFSARISRLCSDFDFLAHFILDVPPEDLFKDLSDYRKARIPFSRQEPCWFPAIVWKEVHFGDLRGYGEAASIMPTCRSLEQVEC